MAEGLGLAVWVPVIVGLVVSVPFLERVIKVAVEPVHLGNNTEEEGHLCVLVRLEVVARTHWVKHLVQIGVNHLVSEVVVRLLPIVLRDIGRVEVDH